MLFVWSLLGFAFALAATGPLSPGGCSVLDVSVGFLWGSGFGFCRVLYGLLFVSCRVVVGLLSVSCRVLVVLFLGSR